MPPGPSRPFLALGVLAIATSIALSSQPARAEDSMHQYLKGHFVYDRMCLPCHGRRGRGDGEWSKDLKDKPRNFRVGVFKFRSTPCGFLPTEVDLKRTIRHGISGTAMPAFKELTDDEVDALIVFVKNLSSRWDDPELHAKPVKLPDLPEWFTNDETRAAQAGEGRKVFETTCAVCHGTEGKGDGPGSKALKDIWGYDITPADLSAPHHKSGDTPNDLYRTIALGLDGTPMAGYHGTFDEKVIWSLVAFIKNLEKEEGAE